MQKHLHIVDGNSILYRAYYGIPFMSSVTGVATNAIKGLLDHTFRYFTLSEPPSHLIMVFDKPGSSCFRHGIYTEYKGTRRERPDDLTVQLPLARQMIAAMGIPVVEEPTVEADDVIVSLTRKFDVDGKVTVVTCDKDLLQICDENVTLYDPFKRVFMGPETAVEKFGVPPKLVPDVQALMGDSSDNIPGVPGVGVKTGASLIQKHGTLESLLAYVLARKGNLKALTAAEKKVLIHHQQASLSMALARLVDYRPDHYDFKQAEFKGCVASLKEDGKLKEFLEELSFEHTIERMGL